MSYVIDFGRVRVVDSGTGWVVETLRDANEWRAEFYSVYRREIARYLERAGVEAKAALEWQVSQRARHPAHGEPQGDGGLKIAPWRKGDA